MTPKTLDFNFEQRRIDIMNRLWSDLKIAFKALERLDQLQELLNQETRDMAEDAPITSNGHKPKQIAAKSGSERNGRSKRFDHNRARFEAKRYIAKHPGATSFELAEQLTKSGAMPNNLKTPNNVLNRMLRGDPELEGRQPHYTGGARKPMEWFQRGTAPVQKAVATKKKPKKATILATEINMRQFILDTLITVPEDETRTPRQLKALAVEAGFPEFSGPRQTERISNMVSRSLRHLLAKGQVKRRETDSDLFYSLNRPKLTITKEE